MSFSKDCIRKLLNSIDIEQIIGTFIKLKQKPQAQHEYLAKCPFHNERSPSFTVTTKKQFYHCFGCGAHGNAISFVMEHQGIDYVNAVKKVAEIGKFKLPTGTNPSKKKISDRRKHKKKLHLEEMKKWRSKRNEEHQ